MAPPRPLGQGSHNQLQSWHWVVGHHYGEQVQGGEIEEREAECFVGWGERRIWRGEGGEKQAATNGLLTIWVQGDTWVSAIVKVHVLVQGLEVAKGACVDVSGSFLLLLRVLQRPVIWASTSGHFDIQVPHCLMGHANLSDLCCLP